MSKFIITAQMALRPVPQAQISAIVGQINKSLGGIKANVNVNIPKTATTQINSIKKGLAETGKAANLASSEMEKFGKLTSLAARRFAAFTLGTGGYIALALAIKNSVKNAIEFDREMVRVAQVTGQSLNSVEGLRKEIFNLSTGFGVSSAKLSKVATTLAQAGLTANETAKALKILAKTELSATFEDINQTTEGAIAILGQFGKGVDNLESQLSSLNAVSAKFAVESSDLITATRLMGAAFANAGGSLEQMFGAFTSVRATTRESAESIATGLRTIFARMQSPKVIDYLHSLGIELRDVNKQFVGPMEAVRRLHEALENVPTTSPLYANIVEQLGGMRQQSRVIPLIQQSALAQDAYNLAMRKGNTLTKDTEVAQQSLAVQLVKVQEHFERLFNTMSNDSGIRAMIELAITLSHAIIDIGEALVKVMPLIIGLAGVKLGTAFGPFVKGAKTVNKNTGGMIPGIGNTDTVPAMLTPGEFVIRKSAVQRVGIGALNSINKYAAGGIVGGGRHLYGDFPGELGKLGFTGQQRSETKIPAGEDFKFFWQEVKKLPTELQKVAKSFNVFTDGTLKVLGRADYASKKVLLSTGANLGVLQHEVGHITEQSLAEHHGLDFAKQRPSYVKGSYVSNTLKEFSSVIGAEDVGQGKKYKEYRQKPQELFAELLARLPDEGKKIFLHKAMNDPALKNLGAIGKPAQFREGVTPTVPSKAGVPNYGAYNISATQQMAPTPYSLPQTNPSYGVAGNQSNVSGKRRIRLHTGYDIAPGQYTGHNGLMKPGGQPIPLFSSPGYNIAQNQYDPYSPSTPQSYNYGPGYNIAPGQNTGNGYGRGRPLILPKAGSPSLGSQQFGTGQFVTSNYTPTPPKSFSSRVGGYFGQLTQPIVPGEGIGSRISSIFGRGKFGTAIKTASENPSGTAIGLAVFSSFIGNLKGMDAGVKKATESLTSLVALGVLFKSMTSATKSFTGSSGMVVREQKKLIELKNADEIDYGAYNKQKRRVNVAKGTANVIGRAHRIAQYAVPGLAAAGIVGGGALSEEGGSLINSGNYDLGRKYAIGGSISQGASTGMMIGSTLGIKGAAGGAVVGGVYGLANGMSDADRQISAHKFGKGEEAFGQAYNSYKLNSETYGKNSKEARLGGIQSQSQYKLLFNSMNLANTANDKTQAEEFKDKLKGLSGPMESLIKDTVTSSKSIEEFDMKIGDAAKAWAKVEGVPWDDYRSNIRKQIDTAEGLRKTNEALRKSSEDLIKADNARMAFTASLSTKFEKLGSDLDLFTNSISGTQALAHGQVQNTRSLAQTGALKNLAFANTNDVRAQAAMGGSIIGGQTGARLAGETTAMSAALKHLPQLLEQVKHSPGMDFHDVESELIKNLKKGGHSKESADAVGKFIRESLDTELGDVSGTGRSDALKKLAGMGTRNTAAQIGEHFNQDNPLAGATQSGFDLMNQLGGQRGEKRNLIGLHQDQSMNLMNSQFAHRDLLMRFNERRMSNQELINRDFARKEIFSTGNALLGPPNTVESFGRRAISAQDDIAGLEKEKLLATQAGDFNAVNKINEDLEKMKDEAANATKALEYFGDAAKRGAQIQEQLSKLEAERKDRLNLGKTLAFGGPQEKMQLVRTLSGAASVAQNPKAFGQMPDQIKKDIFEFFESRGDQMFAGRQSNDILKDLADQIGLGGMVRPNKEEDELRTVLVQYQKDQIEALSASKTITESSIGATNELITTMRDLINNISSLINPQGRATGGMIHGVGNRDSVPAMLTPGEFVMRKAAVQRIGAGNLHRMNFADGGDVPTYRDPGDIPDGMNRYAYKRSLMYKAIAANRATNPYRVAASHIANRRAIFNAAATRGGSGVGRNTIVKGILPGGKGWDAKDMNPVFRRRLLGGTNGGVNYSPGLGYASPDIMKKVQDAQANMAVAHAPMVQAMNNFPRTVEMTANHKHEVIINGAQVMNNLMPQIQEMIIAQAKIMVNKMLKDKFPDVGSV